MVEKLLVLAAIATVIISLIAARAWREMKVNGTRSCFAQVNDTFHSLHQKDLPFEIGVEWKVLADADAARLFRKAFGGANPDCGGGSTDGYFQDPWGNHVQIAVRRKDPESDIEYFVWTNGPDGLPNTKDDCASPYGQLLPVAGAR